MIINKHDCGGSILIGAPGDPELEHEYCDRCGAFIYTTVNAPFPTGTDREANRKAWDDGEEKSLN